MCAQKNKGDQEIERDRKRKCDMIEIFFGMDEFTQVNMLTKVISYDSLKCVTTSPTPGASTGYSEFP